MNQMEGPESIEFNTEREKSENEILLEKIMPIFLELQYEYNFGGDEDEEGELIPGRPDFESARDELEEALSEAPAQLKEKTLQSLASLSEKYKIASANE